MAEAFREEVINVALSELLSERGLISSPERIKNISKKRRLPDVVIGDYFGVRTLIEGRIDAGKQTRKSLSEDAYSRITEGLASICIAVIYPSNLRFEADFKRLKQELSRSQLSTRIFTEATKGEWAKVDVDGLTSLLRRAYADLVNEDTLSESVRELEDVIEVAADAFARSSASVANFEVVLGIQKTNGKTNQRDFNLKLSRIAALTLANAMIFQETLAYQNAEISGLHRCLEAEDYAGALHNVWEHVLDDINYYPIFYVSNEILLGLATAHETDVALRELTDIALRIVQRRAALKHDLLGRVYHKLLADAKYFGAYYTTIPAATLLLKLTLQPNRWDVSWNDVESVKKFVVCDFACGTGTLIKAALQTIVDNYVYCTAKVKDEPHLDEIHRVLVEDSIWGLDVLPFATHLAASTLAMNAPEVQFSHMNLYCLPHGGENSALGSLDLLNQPFDRRTTLKVHTTFSAGVSYGASKITGTGEVKESLAMPDVDLCVMNPPFTRSVGGNLLFGALPEEQRRNMQTILKKKVKSTNLAANVTAGLGSVFVALGDQHLNENGFLSLVLPQTLLSGESWEKTRQLISENYEINYIIVSHEYDNWNFSENTELSECLIIAKKTRFPKRDPIFVNLERKPRNSVEALTLANLIIQSSPAHIDGKGIYNLMYNIVKYGECLQIPRAFLTQNKWIVGAAFAHTDLCRTGFYLKRGEIYIPRAGVTKEIPTVALKDIANVGPDVRDIHDGFSTSETTTSYPAFWSHDSTSTRTLNQQPNKYLDPLVEAKRGRKLRDANLLWSRAGELLLVERVWCETHSVLAVRLSTEVLSNTWWPIKLKDTTIDRNDLAKLLALWFNSTLGIISLFSSKTVTRGGWIKFKKPTIENLSVPDFVQLPKSAIQAAVDKFSLLANSELKNLTMIAEDATRKEIDDTICNLLGIPSLEPLRELLAREPDFNVVHENEPQASLKSWFT